MEWTLQTRGMLSCFGIGLPIFRPRNHVLADDASDRETWPTTLSYSRASRWLVPSTSPKRSSFLSEEYFRSQMIGPPPSEGAERLVERLRFGHKITGR